MEKCIYSSSGIVTRGRILIHIEKVLRVAKKESLPKNSLEIYSSVLTPDYAGVQPFQKSSTTFEM